MLAIMQAGFWGPHIQIKDSDGSYINGPHIYIYVYMCFRGHRTIYWCSRPTMVWCIPTSHNSNLKVCKLVDVAFWMIFMFVWSDKSVAVGTCTVFLADHKCSLWVMTIAREKSYSTIFDALLLSFGRYEGSSRSRPSDCALVWCMLAFLSTFPLWNSWLHIFMAFVR